MGQKGSVPTRPIAHIPSNKVSKYHRQVRVGQIPVVAEIIRIKKICKNVPHRKQ
jgi:hypothetical protein